MVTSNSTKVANGINGVNGSNLQPEYTLQAEAKRIFDSIVNDKALDVPEEVLNLAHTVQFDGDETAPFYPVPYKCAEAQAAILGYVGLLGNAIASNRYGIEQDVKIDV